MSDDSPRALVCLIEGDSSPFRVELSGNKFIIALKNLIKEEGIDPTEHAVFAKDLTLWKADLAPPSADERKGLTGKYMQGSVKLDDLNIISDYWPATTPPNGKHLHIIVELPSYCAAKKLQQYNTIDADTFDLWPAVTMHAIARGNFGRRATLDSNKIVNYTGTKPEFLEQFITKLQQRWIESDTNPAVLVFKNKLDEFGKYFQDAAAGAVQRDGVSNECYECSLWHLLGALSFHGWRKGDVKEVSVWWIFGQLGWHFRSVLGSRANDAFRADWPFPLIVSAEGKKFSHTPRSYFHVSVGRLVHFLVEVQSDKNQGDRYRMLLQAACAARLGRLVCNKPFIVVALYIENTGKVTRYLLFQRDDDDSTVSFVSDTFDWTKPFELFDAMFQLYNLTSTIPSEVSQGERIVSLNPDILENFKDSFMSKKGMCDDPSEDETGSTTRSRGGRGGQGGFQHGEEVYHDLQVVDAFTRAGYTLESNEEDEDGWAPLNQLRPTMRSATRSTGGSVVVKLLGVRSSELEILEHLHSVKSPYNHTIPLLDTFKLDVGTFIVLPEATPLNIGFAFGEFRSDVLDFSRQLLEGLAYLHSRGIAHLDIKPENLVALSKQLFIIDFDIAVRVDGEDALIDRRCGTLEWMAPEIGREDEPKRLYSPIRADLWSCGLVLQYLASKGAVKENPFEGLTYRLLNKNPQLRPLLCPQGPFTFTVGHSLSEDGGMKRKRDDDEG